MNDQKIQLIDKIKSAKNVLVTVSANPTVDQLAAAISLTLLLNKLDKHATAVYSGETPSTIQFLQPEATIEKNTDSLRDFIISLDKAKADKLRYKVEERVVKIFITPYRTSLTDKDLEFSQGDFNVDVVIALGVHHQQDLDTAITSHGRILHDAVVTTINNTPDGDLGSLNWQDLSASSLSEQVASLGIELGENLLDDQIATALLTGIVAETGRFRNIKTTPRTMSISAELMAAGANQQLVATELEQKPTSPEVESDLQITSLPDVAVADKSDDDTPEAPTPPKSNDGTLEIDHHVAGTEPEIAENTPTPDEAQPPELPKTSETTESEAILPEVPAEPTHTIEDVKTSGDSAEAEAQASEYERTPPKLVTEPPTMGGMLTANSRPEALDPSTDPMSVHGVDAPLLSRPSFDSVELSSASPVISPKEQEEPRQDSAGSSPVTAPSYNSFLSSLPKQTTQLDDVLPETTDKPATEQDVVASNLPATGSLPPLQTPNPTPDLPTITPPTDAPTPDKSPESYDHETLATIEAEIHHDPAPMSGVDSARQAVEDAIKGLPAAGDTGPITALNAQPFGEDLRPPQPPANGPQQSTGGAPEPAGNPIFDITAQELPVAPDPFANIDAPLSMPVPGSLNPSAQTPLGQPTAGLPSTNEPAPLANSPADQPFTMPLPPSINMPPPEVISPTASPSANPQAPPPVPPPMMPPGFVNPNQQ
jgi:hypothetical protein